MSLPRTGLQAAQTAAATKAVAVPWGQFLEALATVLAILGVLFPVLAGAALYKLSQKFATKEQLETGLEGVRKDMHREMTQVRLDMQREVTAIREAHQASTAAILNAIKASERAMCKDIDGIGERVTATQRVAEMAMSRADAAEDMARELKIELQSLSKHGSQGLAGLRSEVKVLSEAVTELSVLVRSRTHNGG